MTDLISRSAAASVRARVRIAPMIYQTPLLPSRVLGDRLNCNLRFKAENFQLTGSFKMRGAASKMTALPPFAQSGQRLITASSGNHGIAASRAAALTGQNLTVVLPETVARAKLAKIEAFGVTVILHGPESGAAEAHAAQLAASGEYTYVSPYNDAQVIAGQGTCALEMLDQTERIDNVFVAMGGGGLIGGIGAVLKAFSPKTRVIGVSAQNSAALAASMIAGHVVETTHLDTLADGVAGGVDADTLTLPLAMEVVDSVRTCTEVQIAAALKLLAQDETLLVEGAAALALAGYLQMAEECRGQNNVIVLCGSNFDRDTVMPLVV
ncbi:pyridoxal-phosphate dependent enzyme [Rhodobacteraceae bacterium KMM 6894]|nr:pyridoxal-phosphate dependent enzyme [Rhodobacteraceae bacterium KMM 6894]